MEEGIRAIIIFVVGMVFGLVFNEISKLINRDKGGKKNDRRINSI